MPPRRTKPPSILARWATTRKQTAEFKKFCGSHNLKPTALSLKEINIAIIRMPSGRPKEMALLAYDLLEKRTRGQ